MSTVASPGSRTGRGGLASGRANFRQWRQSRPFWGCAFGLFAGVEIYVVAAAPLKVMAMQGLPGLLTLMIALAAIVCSGVTLFQPHLRTLTGIIVLVLGPISILATNLGGFIIGMVLLIVGGGLILAWRPGEGPGAPVAGTAVADDRWPDDEVARATTPGRYSRPADDVATASHPTVDPPPVPAAPAPAPAPEDGTAPTAPENQSRPRYSWETNPDGTKPVQSSRRFGFTGIMDTMFGAKRPSRPAPPSSGRKRPPAKRSGPATRTRPPQKRPSDRPATPGDGGPTQET